MSGQGLSSRAIIGKFYETLEASVIGWVSLISMYFTSDQESETYKWLGMSPAMRLWIGGRNAKGFRENGITVTNLHFEATLEVAVKDLRRDKTGQILLRIQEMADRANAHWASLLSTLLINGASTVCYDGQYFFDTDHSDGNSGIQSNSISIDISTLPAATQGTPTLPSVEEMALCILQSISQIQSFKDDQGEPINETAKTFLVIVPTPLNAIAAAAISSKTLAGGADNPLAKSESLKIELAVNPRLTWTDEFATFRTDGRTKPFICQEEDELKLKVQAEGSQIEFDKDMHQYGVDSWRNVGYGMWQHACKVRMT